MSDTCPMCGKPAASRPLSDFKTAIQARDEERRRAASICEKGADELTSQINIGMAAFVNRTEFSQAIGARDALMSAARKIMGK